MRIATAITGGLVLASAAMAAEAFTSDDDGADRVSAPSATTTVQAPARAHAGLAIWVAQGCGSCHTLAAANARGTFGPDLGASLAGTPAASIRRSIVAPNAEAATGYDAGMMPKDYGSRITPGDLDRLVAFLRVSAR